LEKRGSLYSLVFSKVIDGFKNHCYNFYNDDVRSMMTFWSNDNFLSACLGWTVLTKAHNNVEAADAASNPLKKGGRLFINSFISWVLEAGMTPSIWAWVSKMDRGIIYTGEDLKWDTPQGCHFKSLPIPRH
jgi:hypothetical protein